MRMDKYLKVSRLIKRREVANKACQQGKVLVNGKEVKPSYDVKIGDKIEIKIGANNLNVVVTSLKEYTKKEDAKELYDII